MIETSSTIQYRLITNYLFFSGVHSIAKLSATIFLPENVIPRIIMNKNN
jgi:hypothetical protein